MEQQLNTSSRKEFVASFPHSFVRGAEVGVSSGDFAKNILSVAPNVKLWCVDVWETNYQLPNPDRSYQETIDNLTPFGTDRFEMVRQGSPESANLFADGFFDFVYIDADHDYQPVLDDINAWYPKIKSGGILFGHDYSEPWEGWEGVIRAVNDFCEKNSYALGIIEAKYLHDGDQDGGSESWYIIKR